MRFADTPKLFVLLLPLLQFYTADETQLRTALNDHRWFDLRDSVISGHAPALYRFFVAAAFNDVRGAEKELTTAIRAGTYRDKFAAMH